MAIIAGFQAAVGKWNNMGPGSPLGQKLFVNNKFSSMSENSSLTVGWHATNLYTVKGQIENGVFEKRGNDIYFAHCPKLATHFGAVGKEIVPGTCVPAVLKIASVMRPVMNEAFGTYYFPATTSGDVHILEAYEVCRKYLQYITDPNMRPSLKEKILQALLAGSQAYLGSAKPNEKTDA